MKQPCRYGRGRLRRRTGTVIRAVHRTRPRPDRSRRPRRLAGMPGPWQVLIPVGRARPGTAVRPPCRAAAHSCPRRIEVLAGTARRTFRSSRPAAPSRPPHSHDLPIHTMKTAHTS